MADATVKRKERNLELRYEYGFLSPKGELVVCSSLQEAQFFKGTGARLVLREIRTRCGEWKALEGGAS